MCAEVDSKQKYYNQKTYSVGWRNIFFFFSFKAGQYRLHPSDKSPRLALSSPATRLDSSSSCLYAELLSGLSGNKQHMQCECKHDALTQLHKPSHDPPKKKEKEKNRFSLQCYFSQRLLQHRGVDNEWESPINSTPKLLSHSHICPIWTVLCSLWRESFHEKKPVFFRLNSVLATHPVKAGMGGCWGKLFVSGFFARATCNVDGKLWPRSGDFPSLRLGNWTPFESNWSLSVAQLSHFGPFFSPALRSDFSTITISH